MTDYFNLEYGKTQTNLPSIIINQAHLFLDLDLLLVVYSTTTILPGLVVMGSRQPSPST